MKKLFILAFALFSTPANATTISGHLFYNDLRTNGLFDTRMPLPNHLHPPGSAGHAAASSSPGTTNYLGALDVTVRLYKIHQNTSGSSCQKKMQISSTTVKSDGSYSFDLPNIIDPCSSKNGNSNIAIEFILRYSDDVRKFHVVHPREALRGGSSTPISKAALNLLMPVSYRTWHPFASPQHPAKVTTQSISLPNAFLEVSSLPGDQDDKLAQASNVFASIVDATRFWHVNHAIPFGTNNLTVIYPADVGTSNSGANIMRIKQPEDWFNGKLVFHEYGHVVMSRMGTIGGCGICPGGKYERDGNSKWSNKTREYPFAALLEGWANFSRRAIENSCDKIDSNTTSPIYPLHAIVHTQGKSYPGNVSKFFCDWYDEQNDNDLSLVGQGDTFTAKSLKSMWKTMSEMSAWTGTRDGLNICDFMKTYLMSRKTTLPSKKYQMLVKKISDLGLQNGIVCVFSGGVISLPTGSH